MKLYLVQHAEAKKKDEDPQRPLSEKGWTDIKKVAAFAAEQANIKVSNIMHSGKTRARQTAEAMADYLTPPEGIRKEEGLEPLADPLVWAGRLTNIEADIMLVGHLPHLSKLAAFLLCQDTNKEVIQFRMGTIVCLGRDESGIWSLHWMVTPQLLR